MDSKSLLSVASLLPWNARIRKLSHADVRKVCLGTF